MGTALTVYHSDPYIQSLAAEQTACHGFVDGTEPLCQQCPLATSCGSAKIALLSQMAKVLSAEDAEKAKPKRQQQAPAASAPAAPIVNPFTDKDFSNLDVNTTTDIAAAIKAICRGCGKEIQKGDPAKWVRSKGGGAKGSAMFHAQCFDTVFNKK